MKNSSEEKEIILNRMYSGSYLENENENIGFEIINLVKDDANRNYIYILPYGTIANKHDNKIDSILLVRYCGSGVMEILAKATDLQQIAFNKETFNKESREYISDNNITYNDVKLYDIFEKNIFTKTNAYITFKAGNVTKPKQPIYIVDKMYKNDDEYSLYKLNDVRFANQSPKTYISNQKNPNSFNLLNGMISDKKLWGQSTKKLKTNKKDLVQKKSFISIIQKENDELVFSNLFKYIFESNINAFQKFAKDVLNVNLDKNISIKREQHCNFNNVNGFIDLFITDNQNTIVIENKIKSGINGVSSRHDIYSNEIQSQLTCYKGYIDENFSDKQNHFFIFAPNYNHVDIKKFKDNKYYKIINYKTLYTWFLKNRKDYKDVDYFDEFLIALKKHTSETENNHEEVMRQRFITMINNIKTEKQR